MSPWGWTPERNLGIWRHGAGWLRPAFAAMPYLTVGLLLVQLLFLGGTLSATKGVLFELPSGAFSDVERTDLIALVMPVGHETVVFFDDARYVLGDASSMRNFAENLSERVSHSAGKSLLVLADRRVPSGGLVELVALARTHAVERVLVAGKREDGAE